MDATNFIECTGTFPQATLEDGTPEYFVAEQGAYGNAVLDGNTFTYMSKKEDATEDTIKIGADNGNGDYSVYTVKINLTTKDIGPEISFNKESIEPGEIACAYNYMTNDDKKANRVFAVALYEDGRLKNIEIPETVENETESTSARVAKISVPDDETHTYGIKAFVWESMENMIPYAAEVLEN